MGVRPPADREAKPMMSLGGISVASNYAQAVSINGDPWSGCVLEDREAVERAQVLYPEKGYCLVQDWVLLDLAGPEESLKRIRDEGFEPTILYSRRVVFDSRRRVDIGGWIRSMFQQSLSAEGFFETKNSVYILLGKGFRKQVALEHIFPLSKHVWSG